MAYTVGKSLFDAAERYVLAEQKASYDFLREKFPGIGVGTTASILKELRKRKVVRHGVKKSHVVIVNADGTPKPEDGLPPVRTFKKIVRRKGNGADTHANANGGPIDDRDKIEMLTLLSKASGEKGARVLGAIADDVRFLSKHRKLIETLRD